MSLFVFVFVFVFVFALALALALVLVYFTTMLFASSIVCCALKCSLSGA